MKTLKKTKTLENLMIAFCGESQARNKYSYFAKKARKEGLNEIANHFDLISNNEGEHAKIWYKLINNGIHTTNDNLKDAIKGEHYEWSTMYKNFAKIALKEGFTEIAKLFENVGKIEKQHEEDFCQILKLIKNKNVFARKKTVEWKCMVCGRIIKAKNAPKICDTCKHSQSYQTINCNCIHSANGCQCSIKK